MEYRAAAATAPRQTHIVFFHAPGITLFPWVLCPPDNHRIGVTPEKKYALGGGHLTENTLFHRQVEPGIIRIRDKQTQCGHDRFPFLKKRRFSRCNRAGCNVKSVGCR